MGRILVLNSVTKTEKRVAIDCETTKKLALLGIHTAIVPGAGSGIYQSDEQYIAAGATLYSSTEKYDWVLSIDPPPPELLSSLHFTQGIITPLFANNNKDLVHTIVKSNANVIALEFVPRTTKAQAMDTLSSQATAAGYQAVIRAASLSGLFFPMLTTAVGSIKPARVVVLGAGVAGLQAIATARRLGAIVLANDIRAAAREQVLSLGAKMIETNINAESTGGYARELTSEEKKEMATAVNNEIAKANVVISTAAIPGKKSPLLIDTETVERMVAGSVIIDLAAEGGGNCSLTKPGEIIYHNGIIIDGRLSVASGVATHSSSLFARNISTILEQLYLNAPNGDNFESPEIHAMLAIKQGKSNHPSLVL